MVIRVLEPMPESGSQLIAPAACTPGIAAILVQQLLEEADLALLLRVALAAEGDPRGEQLLRVEAEVRPRSAGRSS